MFKTTQNKEKYIQKEVDDMNELIVKQQFNKEVEKCQFSGMENTFKLPFISQVTCQGSVILKFFDEIRLPL